jgi:hypothetical protein
MSFDGTVSPIGYLDKTQNILDWLTERFEQKNMPIIQCAKNFCLCGLCAPKSQSIDDFVSIMSKHMIDTNIFDIDKS